MAKYIIQKHTLLIEPRQQFFAVYDAPGGNTIPLIPLSQHATRTEAWAAIKRYQRADLRRALVKQKEETVAS